MPILYLASQSPRRRELLAQIGAGFSSLPVDIDETPRAGESPADYVERVAREKARAGLALCRSMPGDNRRVVLGADTAVVLGEEIMGKPTDRSHGLGMLRRLAGASHRVISAVCVADGQREGCAVVETRIRFRAVNETELAEYWATGEPLGKAGGYAIQGLAAVFVEQLSGSYSGVVGLPLFETAALLRDFSVPFGLGTSHE